jgi:hypothetical protein
VIGRDEITELLGFKPFNCEILGRLASRRGVKLAPSRPIRGLGPLANLATGVLRKVTEKVLRFQGDLARFRTASHERSAGGARSARICRGAVGPISGGERERSGRVRYALWPGGRLTNRDVVLVRIQPMREARSNLYIQVPRGIFVHDLLRGRGHRGRGAPAPRAELRHVVDDLKRLD